MLILLRAHWIANRRLFLNLTPLWLLWFYTLFQGTKAGQDAQLLLALSLTMGATFTAIVVLQGLTQPVESYLLSLPVRRRDLVAGVYGSGLIASVVGAALPLLMIKGLLWRTPIPWDLAGLLWATLAVGLFCFLPLRFWFGGQRALSGFVGSLVSGLVILQMTLGVGEGAERLAAWAQRGLENPWFLGGGTAALLIALGWLSLSLACKGMARRSF